MELRMIKSPSQGTIDILLRRMTSNQMDSEQRIDAIGLVQGRLIEMIWVADVAEKAANVVVEDIRGSCPQNMLLLAIFGDTASVEAAFQAISENMSGGIKL